MDFKLSLDVRPLTQRLESIQAGLADRTVLHERIIITLKKRVDKNWPKGPALSPFTKLSRRGQAVLQDTGFLRQSLIGQNPAQVGAGEGSLDMASKAVSVFGTSAVYARVQNFGATLQPKRAKYLALPMSQKARKLKSPRDFTAPPLVPWPLKSGKGYYLVEGEHFLVTRGKNKGQTHIRPKKMPSGQMPPAHYLLRKESVIPARRFFPTDSEVAEVVNVVGTHWLNSLYQGQPQVQDPAA